MDQAYERSHSRSVPGSNVSRGDVWTGPALVVAATTFNLPLCFVNTMHWLTIGPAQISAVQIVIFAAALFTVRHGIGETLVATSILLMGLVAGLKLFNPEIDLKILFDVAMIPVFIRLGRLSSLEQTGRLVKILIALVLVFGVAELIAPGVYEHMFDIRSYYLNKGAIDPNAINYSDTNFFTSGERSSDTGRNLLAGLLGPHRVSSLFLEPVSMGNFPIVCLVWLLGLKPAWTKWTVTLIISIAACIVLPDSRYAIGCSLLMVCLSLCSWRRSNAVSFVLPLLTIAALCLFGTTQLVSPGATPGIVNDDLVGRLRFSGALLNFWSTGSWLGMEPSPVYTADTGYAYLINQIGLPMTVILWALFSLGRPRSARDLATRSYVALYVSTSLCIGASLFSIKTAALLWFVVGTLQVSRSREHGLDHFRFT